MNNNRMIMCTKDVQMITGKSQRTAMRLMQKIRMHMNKPSGSMVTIFDFCAFTNIPEEKVREVLR